MEGRKTTLRRIRRTLKGYIFYQEGIFLKYISSDGCMDAKPKESRRNFYEN